MVRSEDKKHFENTQWIVWNWGIEENPINSGSGYWLDKGNISADPKLYFDHVAEKNWVNPDLLFQAFEQGSKVWGIDDRVIEELKSSVPYHKECKAIYEEVNQRMGEQIHGLFESERHYKEILKENPSRYPILTKMEHGESE